MADAKLETGEVYLVGVHSNVKELILCTKMKLSIEEIVRRGDSYEPEMN